MGSGGSTAPQCSSSAELMLSYILQVYVVEQEPPQYYAVSTPPTYTVR